MATQQRHNDDRQRAGGDPTDGADGGANLDGLRDNARQLLRAGGAAIDRALSDGNSEAWLNATRQQGGQ